MSQRQKLKRGLLRQGHEGTGLWRRIDALAAALGIRYDSHAMECVRRHRSDAQGDPLTILRNSFPYYCMRQQLCVADIAIGSYARITAAALLPAGRKIVSPVLLTTSRQQSVVCRVAHLAIRQQNTHRNSTEHYNPAKWCRLIHACGYLLTPQRAYVCVDSPSMVKRLLYAPRGYHWDMKQLTGVDTVYAGDPIQHYDVLVLVSNTQEEKMAAVTAGDIVHLKNSKEIVTVVRRRARWRWEGVQLRRHQHRQNELINKELQKRVNRRWKTRMSVIVRVRHRGTSIQIEYRKPRSAFVPVLDELTDSTYRDDHYR